MDKGPAKLFRSTNESLADDPIFFSGGGDAAVRRRLAKLGQDIPPVEKQTPDALAAFHKAEVEKWWPIIKAANIKAE